MNEQEWKDEIHRIAKEEITKVHNETLEERKQIALAVETLYDFMHVINTFEEGERLETVIANLKHYTNQEDHKMPIAMRTHFRHLIGSAK